MKRSLETAGRLGALLILSFYLLVVVYPFCWLLTSSLKTDSDIFNHPFSLPPIDDLQWSNFSRAWTEVHFGDYFWNSVILTTASVVAAVFFGAMAAYVLARFVFPGVRPLFFFFIGGLMVPLQLVVVPLFFQLREMNLLNSLFGLWFVYVAQNLPFAIFILTGFFRSLPSSLHESALVDGAGEWTAFFKIMLPLARPGLITVAVFTFLNIWGEFFTAFMFLSGEGSEGARTLPLGLANVTVVSEQRSDYGLAFAGLVLMVLPPLLFYMFLQKHLVKGITEGAVKG